MPISGLGLVLGVQSLPADSNYTIGHSRGSLGVHRVIQKNTPTRKSQYLRNIEKNVHQISLICLGQNCA